MGEALSTIPGTGTSPGSVGHRSGPTSAGTVSALLTAIHSTDVHGVPTRCQALDALTTHKFYSERTPLLEEINSTDQVLLHDGKD